MAVFVGALMVLSAFSAATALAAPAPSTPAASLSLHAAAAPAPPSATSAGASGQNPAGEPLINPIPYGMALKNYPRLLKAANEKFDGNSSTFGSVGTPSTRATSLSTAGVPAPPAASPTLNYGYIVGRVVATKPPNPALSGAVVAAEPVTDSAPRSAASRSPPPPTARSRSPPPSARTRSTSLTLTT